MEWTVCSNYGRLGASLLALRRAPAGEGYACLVVMVTGLTRSGSVQLNVGVPVLRLDTRACNCPAGNCMPSPRILLRVLTGDIRTGSCRGGGCACFGVLCYRALSMLCRCCPPACHPCLFWSPAFSRASMTLSRALAVNMPWGSRASAFTPGTCSTSPGMPHQALKFTAHVR